MPEEKLLEAALPFGSTEAQTFARFIEHAMSLTGDPGAAVAVIQDGKIVFRQGFGVTRLGQETPVTPETAFASARQPRH